MMATSIDVTTIISGAAALTSVLATLLTYLQARSSRAEAINLTETKRLEEALSSDEIGVLGDYLYKELGSVSLADFGSDEHVMSRVDAVIARTEAFLGTPESVSERVEEPPPVEPPAEPPRPEATQRVQQEIQSGEVWNALARLRREIEIQLRDMAVANGLTVEKYAGAGQLLRALLRAGYISREAESSLRYAINVCNRGIHGLDVEPGEAEEALNNAEVGLAFIRSQIDERRT